MARLASASRPSSTRPTRNATANGRSSRRSVKCGSAARACPASTPGVSVAGGRASTWASSSGEAGIPARKPPPASALAVARSARAGAASAGHSRLRAGAAAVAVRAVVAVPAGTAARAAFAVHAAFAAGVVGQFARVDPLRVLAGPGEQQPVQRAAGHQLLVAALVDQAPLVQHRDPLRELQGRAPVGDEQRGAAVHDPPERLVDLGLHLRVDRGRGVVEHQDRGVGEQRAGQGHPLALPAGQGEPLLADHRVVAVRQGGDEAVGLGRPCRRHDLLPGGVRPAERDVGPRPCRRTGSSPPSPARWRTAASPG